MPAPNTTFTCSVVGCKSYCVLDPREAARDVIGALKKRGWLTQGENHYCLTHHGQTKQEDDTDEHLEKADALPDSTGTQGAD